MFYSENHVEVSLDAFLASEEFAKESIKDLKIDQGSVFDQKTDRSMQSKGRTKSAVFWLQKKQTGVERQGRMAKPWEDV